MHPALAQTDHRPWPLPKGPWTWRQEWRDILFAHWPAPAAALRRLVPAEVEIDEYDGTSWIGVVPFRMAGVARRPLPDFPGVSAFPELNLRLYVSHRGKPGVWFLSLDAGSGLAAWTARRLVGLPYWHARMSIDAAADGGFAFRSERRGATPPVRFAARWRPTGAVFRAAPGSFEEFLVERYCLYALGRGGQLVCGDVHHVPWPLQPAEGEVDPAELLRPHGLAVDGPPRLLCSTGVAAIAWGVAPA